MGLYDEIMLPNTASVNGIKGKSNRLSGAPLPAVTFRVRQLLNEVRK